MQSAATSTTVAADANRFSFIDALRGIAAMLVVLFHLHGATSLAVGDYIGVFGNAILAQGRVGVDIFFVISGFVIAYSVGTRATGWRFLGVFAMRRAIRLDPPYLASIALEIAAIVATAMFLGTALVLPSMAQVAAHVVYLQNVLGYGDINPVYWSLCFEVQFYLLFVCAAICGHKLAERGVIAVTGVVAPLVAAAAFTYSLAIYTGHMPAPHPGSSMLLWWQFFLGVLAWRCVRDQAIRADMVYLTLLTMLALLIGTFSQRFAVIVALATAWLIVFVGLRGALVNALSGRVLQFLGRISYSLYLIHPIVGWRLIRLLGEVTPLAGIGVVGGLILFSLGVAGSIVSAWILNIAIERPAQQFAKRIRWRDATAPRSGVSIT